MSPAGIGDYVEPPEEPTDEFRLRNQSKERNDYGP